MPLTPEDVANKQFTSTRLKPGYDETEVDEFLDEIEAELTRLYRENDELRSKLAQAARGGAVEAAPGPDTAAMQREIEDLRQKLAAASRAPQPAAPAPAGPDPAAQREIEDLRQKLAAAQRQLAEAANRRAAEAAPAAVPAGGVENATGILALAQRTADEHIAEARTQADRMIGEARTRAEQLKREAEDRHRQTIGTLETERAGLERKVEQLRAFEREYRSRLKSYLEGQLRELEGDASQAPGGAPGAGERGTGPAGPPGQPAQGGQPGQPAQPAQGAQAPRSPFSPGAPVSGGQAPSGPPQQPGGGFPGGER